MRTGATWSVVYTDGQVLNQYDAGHAMAVEGEVPYRAIEWPRVGQVRFESQFCISTFDFAHPGPEWEVSLHSRHFMSMASESFHCFLIAIRPLGVRKEEAVTVFYWFPDDTKHECYLYDCPDVRGYGRDFLHEGRPALKPLHERLTVVTDAVLDPDVV